MGPGLRNLARGAAGLGEGRSWDGTLWAALLALLALLALSTSTQNQRNGLTSE